MEISENDPNQAVLIIDTFSEEYCSKCVWISVCFGLVSNLLSEEFDSQDNLYYSV